MNIDDMILVSVDDHVIEPAHMFEGGCDEVRRTTHPASSAATTARWPGATTARRSSTPR